VWGNRPGKIFNCQGSITRIEVQINPKHSVNVVFSKTTRNNPVKLDERPFLQIRDPGSFTELAPLRPAKRIRIETG
jgi:hypothetical protein